MTYTDDTPMPIGKHKMVKLKDLPAGYLLNIYNNKSIPDPDLMNYIQNNLEELGYRKESQFISLKLTKFICDKKTYPTKAEAQKMLHVIKHAKGSGKKPTRAYECPKCSGWHLTSMPFENFKEKAMKTQYDDRTIGPDYEGPPRRYREVNQEEWEQNAINYVRAKLDPDEVYDEFQLHEWAVNNGYIKQSTPDK